MKTESNVGQPKAPASPRGEQGGIILSGLLKTALALLVVALLAFEAGAVAVNTVQLDEAARSASHAATVAWRDAGSERAVHDAVARSLATQTGMQMQRLVVENDLVEVTVSRQAPVFVIDRIAPLAPLAQGVVTKIAAL